MRLNVGCGRLRIPGYVGVDFQRAPSVDLVFDVGRSPWPLADGCASEVIAWHVLEHLPGYALHTAIKEAHRVLAPGATLYVKVPYREWPVYNPNHFRSFDERSFNWWIRNGDGPDACLQADHSLFRRARQEVVRSLPGGFLGWHMSRSRLGWAILRAAYPCKDERGRCTPLRFLPGEWELREWLVKA